MRRTPKKKLKSNLAFSAFSLTTVLQVKPSVDIALKCGYRLFDTAKYYQNESELGAALQELLPKHGLTRADVFITTKFHMDPDDPAGGARKLVLESLKQLRVSYIDMVLIHYPKAIKCDEKDPKNKEHRKLSYLELEKLKEEGKIRSVGVSNYEISHIEEIKNFSKVILQELRRQTREVCTDKMSQMVPCANQVELHPHFTREELRQYCRKEGIFLQVRELLLHGYYLIHASVPMKNISYAMHGGKDL
ncbi:oxidoreductase, aldo/keto reductase family protein [Ancylostoma caninum]|uniref:Oxidoreductase, aldo/keto reductase family protein n=1 Tax=Ancylostoma caninum TaxID=29170 RepID=A0A368GY15_ANCCA|nr:oxidoreductase, aldo/keto reductase family protein [Ancylostoma caninum]